MVGTGGRATAGYRAFWLYLEAVWSDQAAAESSDPAGHAAAVALVRQSEEVLGLGSWVRQMAPFPAAERSALSAPDALAVAQIASRLERKVNQATILRQIGAVHAGLGERDPGKYEPALTDLGKLLGAEAFKPASKGRCDSVWPWGNEVWIAIEAKSDHDPSGVVPHKDIRQANDQLRLLAKDAGLDVAPLGSVTVVVSPKPAIHPDGITAAEDHVHYSAPAAIAEIAYDADSAWNEILTKAPNRSLAQLRALVGGVFESHGILPSQILERLSREPINDRSA